MKELLITVAVLAVMGEIAYICHLFNPGITLQKKSKNVIKNIDAL